MTPPRPDDVLPHRAPFLFVTEVTSVEPGVSARGFWELTGDESFFAGAFVACFLAAAFWPGVCRFLTGGRRVAEGCACFLPTFFAGAGAACAVAPARCFLGRSSIGRASSATRRGGSSPASTNGRTSPFLSTFRALVGGGVPMALSGI